MSLRQETTATVEIELTAEQKQALRQELQILDELYLDRQELDNAIETMVARVRELREATGAKSVDLGDGFKSTGVAASESRSLNKKKVYALGITPAQFESCYTFKPKKGYELVTTPHSKKPKAEEAE